MKKYETRSRLLTFIKDLDLGFEELKLKKMKLRPGVLPKNIPQEILEDIIIDLEGRLLRELALFIKNMIITEIKLDFVILI